ncbi:hypothetical protein N0V83_004816 [Neocucurbitaria cava]|uniref:Uncharacterized protein n=1 Tax=Neocucurbitaria cava TaxID=798079 RepID=A0A9W9CNC6_9PLEO|nr:hypothetical protein N0V83_004816 [Neocucurbitaria cava]
MRDTMTSRLDDMGGRIRQDLLYRLRWNLLAALDNIDITTGPQDEESVVPFFSDAAAEESIAQPPLSRVEVRIDDCLANRLEEMYFDEEDQSNPPADLTIENADGSPITVGQFVSQVHPYMNEHMEENKKVKGEIYGRAEKREDGTEVRVNIYGQPYLPPDIGFFFSRVWAVGHNDYVRLNVSSFAEGEIGTSVDDFWAIQLRQARMCEQKRYGEQATIESLPLSEPGNTSV